MQTRTTTPDGLSKDVKQLYRDMRDGKLSRFAFAAAIAYIWERRHGRA